MAVALSRAPGGVVSRCIGPLRLALFVYPSGQRSSSITVEKSIINNVLYSQMKALAALVMEGIMIVLAAPYGCAVFRRRSP
jgi:hypothetical protein